MKLAKKTLKELKEKLQQAPTLGYPKDKDMYTLATDASVTVIVAILTQKQQDMEVVNQIRK